MTDLAADQAARRLALQAAIAALPDEAFSYLALELWVRPIATTRHAVWPDGLGGFEAASQAAILHVLDAATQFCTQGVEHYAEPKDA